MSKKQYSNRKVQFGPRFCHHDAELDFFGIADIRGPGVRYLKHYYRATDRLYGCEEKYKREGAYLNTVSILLKLTAHNFGNSCRTLQTKFSSFAIVIAF